MCAAVSGNQAESGEEQSGVQSGFGRDGATDCGFSHTNFLPDTQHVSPSMSMSMSIVALNDTSMPPR